MLLRAIETDTGHITIGKVYESVGIIGTGFMGEELMVIVFNDSGEWMGVDITFFEPAVERS